MKSKMQKIVTALVGVTLFVSAAPVSYASNCRDQIRENIDTGGGIAFGTFGAIGTAAALASGGLAGPILLILSGPMFLGGAQMIISGLHQNKFVKLLDQAADGDGKLLRKYYKRYVSQVTSLNAKATESVPQYQILTYEGFSKLIHDSDESGLICKSGVLGKSGVASALIYYQHQSNVSVISLE